MIQRKQTLFFLELLFLGVALLFIPNSTVVMKESSFGVCLLPVGGEFASSPCHLAAIILNFINLALVVVTIFLYKKRTLQIKLSYLLAVFWGILIAIIAFCPMVEHTNEAVAVQVNHSSTVIGIFAIIAAILAARFIRKDIDLLKSADRIR